MKEYEDMGRFQRSNKVLRAAQAKDVKDAPQGAFADDWIVYLDPKTPVVLADGLFRLLFTSIEG